MAEDHIAPGDRSNARDVGEVRVKPTLTDRIGGKIEHLVGKLTGDDTKAGGGANSHGVVSEAQRNDHDHDHGVGSQEISQGGDDTQTLVTQGYAQPGHPIKPESPPVQPSPNRHHHPLFTLGTLGEDEPDGFDYHGRPVQNHHPPTPSVEDNATKYTDGIPNLTVDAPSPTPTATTVPVGEGREALEGYIPYTASRGGDAGIVGEGSQAMPRPAGPHWGQEGRQHETVDRRAYSPLGGLPTGPGQAGRYAYQYV